MERKHAHETKTQAKNFSVFDPARWGLPVETVKNLGVLLHEIWQRFQPCFTTLRHDTSAYALIYLKGLMLLPHHRNYQNIARAGDKSAGAAHQYIGHVGKIEMGQVGVALGYHAAKVWTMVDAELFLSRKAGFDPAHQKRHRRLHIPKDRPFQTKLEIGLQRIDQALSNDLPFSRLSCDAFYGKSHEFRAQLRDRKISYLADIPSDLQVYLQAPEIKFQTIEIRPCERGRLSYDCARQPVWTLT